MKNRKINIDRAELTDDEIRAGSDFDSILNRVKAVKPFYKDLWFYLGTSGVAMVFFGGYMMYSELSHDTYAISNENTETIENRATTSGFADNKAIDATNPEGFVAEENKNLIEDEGAVNDEEKALQQVTLNKDINATIHEVTSDKLSMGYFGSAKGSLHTIVYSIKLKNEPIRDLTAKKPEKLDGLWRVYWEKGDISRAGVMNLQVQDNGKVRAEIDWVYRLQKAKEILHGTYDPKNQTIGLTTSSVVDENGLLELGHKYDLDVSGDLTFINGPTASAKGKGAIYYGENMKLFKKGEPAPWDGTFSSNRLQTMEVEFSPKGYFNSSARNTVGALFLTLRDNPDVDLELFVEAGGKKDLLKKSPLSILMKYLRDKGIEGRGPDDQRVKTASWLKADEEVKDKPDR